MARRGTAASINLGDLEKLAALQCTDEEMGGFFGVSTRTIERRRKSPVFAQTIERGKARGRISLRRAQLKMVEDGSATIYDRELQSVAANADQHGSPGAERRQPRRAQRSARRSPAPDGSGKGEALAAR